jgi:hypothetical protein
MFAVMSQVNMARSYFMVCLFMIQCRLSIKGFVSPNSNTTGKGEGREGVASAYLTSVHDERRQVHTL